MTFPSKDLYPNLPDTMFDPLWDVKFIRKYMEDFQKQYKSGDPLWYRHDTLGFKLASVGREIPFQEPKNPDEPNYTIGKINLMYIPEKGIGTPWDQYPGPLSPLTPPWHGPLAPKEDSDVIKRAEEMLKKYQKKDNVNHPEHYKLNEHGIECIDAIEASMSKEGFKGYLKGNVMKYLWRYEYKGKALEDLEKAGWYLNKLKGKL